MLTTKAADTFREHLRAITDLEDAVRVGRPEDITALERALSAARERSVMTRSDYREHLSSEHRQTEAVATNGE